MRANRSDHVSSAANVTPASFIWAASASRSVAPSGARLAARSMPAWKAVARGSFYPVIGTAVELGGLYLAARRMLDWRIPTGVLLGAALTSLPFWLMDPQLYPSPLFVLLSGGLMLGAVFMASDMVASPVTPLGVWLYSLFIGALTVVIRLFGGLTEGVMYAILLGNALSPLIATITQPRVFGAPRRRVKP